jgi:serine/threonine protein kinase
MAPEIIKKLEYDKAVDIWALGVMTYIMLCGRPPFKGKTKDEVFVEITTKQINYSSDGWKTISKEAKNFVKKMLVRDPKQRSSAEDLLKDPYIISNSQGASEITQSILEEVSANMKEFRKNTAFQAGVMTFILSQNENIHRLGDLKNMFNKLD